MGPVAGDHLVGPLQQLVPAAEVEQRPQAGGVDPDAHLGQAPPLGEVEALPAVGQRAGRALGRPQRLAQVAVDHGRVEAGPRGQADGQGGPEVVDPAQVAEVGAGQPAGVQRAHLQLGDVQPPGQLQGPLGPVPARGGLPGHQPVHGQVGVGGAQAGPGTGRLQQLDRPHEGGPGAGRLALVPEHGRELAKGGALADLVAGGGEAGQGLLVGGAGGGDPARLEVPPADPQEEVRPVRVAGREQLKGVGVEGLGPGQVEGQGPVAGQQQGPPGRFPQLGQLVLAAAGRAGQGERLGVVVGDHLGQVGDPGPGQPLQPGGDRPVPAGPPGPGELGVGHVPDQPVGEAVLGLALDRRGLDGVDQLLGLELGQPGPHGRLGGPGERGQGARPEDPAGHGRVLDQRLARRREHVEPGRDQRLDAVREGDGGGGQPHHRAGADQQAPVGEQPDELLGVQRVAAGPLQQRRLDLGGQHRLAEQAGDQPGRLGLGQRRQGDGGGPGDPAAPARMAVEQLWPGGGQHQQPGPGGLGAQVLEELEHRRVGPVQVLDHQHQRMAGRHGLHEPPPGGERLRAVDPGPLGVDQAEQGGDAGLDPLLVGGVGHQRGHGRLQLGLDLARVVGLEHAGLGLDDLGERPEGDPVAVGQAAALAPGDQLRAGVQAGRQLPDQAALADPGGAGHGHQPRRPGLDGLEVDAFQQVQLGLAADQRGDRPGVDAGAAARPLQPPHRHRVGLALDPDRPQLLEVEQPPGRPEGRLADHHPARRGHPLEAGGGVDHVPDHALGGLARIQVDQHLAGGDADPGRQVQLADGGQHPQGAAHGPLGVVLVGHRGAEHGHHAVADELVQGAAEPLDLGPQPGVVGAQQGADVLGVGLVGAGGEADQVAEQHGDDLALQPGRPGRGQRGAAGPAEAEAVGVVLPAGRAARHVRRGCRGRAGGPRRRPRCGCARPAWPGCWRRGRWPSCG